MLVMLGVDPPSRRIFRAHTACLWVLQLFSLYQTCLSGLLVSILRVFLLRPSPRECFSVRASVRGRVFRGRQRSDQKERARAHPGAHKLHPTTHSPDSEMQYQAPMKRSPVTVGWEKVIFHAMFLFFVARMNRSACVQ